MNKHYNNVKKIKKITLNMLKRADWLEYKNTDKPKMNSTQIVEKKKVLYGPKKII